MEPPFPAVSADDPVREAVELLVGDQQALLVTDDGRAGGHRHARRPAGGTGFVSEPERRRDAFATRAVHAGLTPDPTYGSVIPAIHQTSTYAQPGAGRVRRGLRLRALGEPDAGRARAGAGRARGRARRSRSPRGLAAEHALITDVCAAGVARRAARRPLRRHLPARRQGAAAAGACDYDLVDQTDLDALERAVADDTRLDLGRDARPTRC